MDIGKSFTFQFDDKRWLNKLGLAAVITAVPFLNFAFSGYLVELVRNVEHQVAEPLPEWDDLARKLVDGIFLVAATLIYALPGLLLFCLPITLTVASGILSGNERFQDAARSLVAGSEFLFFCFLCVFLVYLLALSVVHPAITIMYSREGTFASCFKVREILAMIQHGGSKFFTAWVGYVVATLIVGFVVGLLGALTGWIPCLGWPLSVVVALGSAVYIGTVYAHLFGQFALARSGQDRGSSSS